MGTIVVGVDGSPGAAEALRWAVAEADIRKAGLRAVMAWGYLAQVHPGGPDFSASYDEVAASEALEAILHEDLGEQLDHGLAVERRVVCDLPARALVEASHDADLLVVGARGLGGVRGLLIGSVSQECLHHATVPVAVVRAGHAAAGHGRVVVGVDGSSHARRALEVAVDEAAARRAELEVVYAWEQPMAAMYPATIPVSVDELQQYADAVMGRMLDDVDLSVLANPPVRSVCEGSPRDILLDRSSTADVLVVGARGIGGFRGMVLGSVSHAVSRHAECTVLVVPPGDD